MRFRKLFLCNLLLFTLFALFIFFLAKSYSDTVFNNISDNFIRLHVVANSDSTKDQILKYKIRDAILDYISPYINNAKSKQEALEILEENINQIYNISYEILESENIDYPLNISIGNFKFPTKDYSKFVLPEGNYDALKVEIGNADGQNWWCVMFPSLCITENSNIFSKENSSEILKNSLNSEEYSIITKNSSPTDIKIKFKIVEIFENL